MSVDYDIGRANEFAGKYEAMIRSVREIVAAHESLVSGLAGSDWKGKGAEAYRARCQNWAVVMECLLEKLEEVKASVENGTSASQHLESEANTVASSV